MSRRMILYIAAGVLGGMILMAGGYFLTSIIGEWQTRRWREMTLLASTGQTLPKEVLREIRRYGKIPLHQVLALCHAESKGDPEAVSEADAKGCMQIMDTVATQYGFEPEEMFDPVKCVYVGQRHFYEMLVAFDGDQRDAVSAYNAGVKGWKRCMDEKRIPKETRKLQDRYFTRARVYGRFLRDGVIE